MGHATLEHFQNKVKPEIFFVHTFNIALSRTRQDTNSRTGLYFFFGVAGD
jgi:hypothetical protein